MQALLRRIGIAREVVALAAPAAHGASATSPRRCGRRPPPTTGDSWRRDSPGAVDAALERLSVIEAANAEEEALAIAVALREAVETPGKTAALVTPDRALARRVLAALERWQVPVDDSGGDALADTAGRRVRAARGGGGARGTAPVTLLALLKHPLLRLGGADGAPRARSRRSKRRCCAARARGRGSAGWRRRSPASAPSLASCGARSRPICTAPIRAPT